MKDDGAATDRGEKKSFFSTARRVLLALIFAHLAITLPLAYRLNIWMDEASTLHTTQNGLFQTLQNFQDEKQAPLYFLLLSVWRGFDDSIFFARLFSIICTCLAIVFFYGLTRKFFDKSSAKFAVVLFAFHPYLIWASLEIRGYALVILLTVGLLKFFAEGCLNNEENAVSQNRKAQIYFVLTAIFALYTNYYTGFLLVGFFAALLVLRRFKAARNYFVQMLLVGLAVAPLFGLINSQIAVNTNGFTAERSIFAGVKVLWSNALNLVLPTELSSSGEQSGVSFIRLWLARFGIVGIIFLLIKNKFRTAADERVLIFGTISFVIFIFLLIAYFAVGLDYIAPRHMAVWFVPLNLFVFAFLSQILPGKLWFIFAIIFTFLYPYSVYRSYPKLAKRGDWIRVAKFIEANEKPNQPIIIFQNYDALALPYYYHGVNKILPDRNFFAWYPQDDFTSENSLKKQIDFVISQVPANAEEIWLATEELCQDKGAAAACQPLENFVETNYTVLETRDFYKERVRLLKKK